jgi:NodT family efflux transporter outer membrane factor (OMF) lipoprotein
MNQLCRLLCLCLIVTTLNPMASVVAYSQENEVGQVAKLPAQEGVANTRETGQVASLPAQESFAAPRKEKRPRKTKTAIRPPRVDVPGSWSLAMGASSDYGITAQSAELQQWWKNLKDPQLDRLVQQAFLNNLDLKLAVRRVREARAARGVAGAARYPEIAEGGSVARRRSVIQTPDGLAAVEGTGFQIGFDANWELDFFGGVRNSVRAATAEVTVAEESERDVMVTMVGEIARNYVALRGYQRQLAVTRANITTERDTRDLTAVRVRAGLATDLDVSRVEAQLARTESAVPGLEAGVSDAVNRLAVLLGTSPGGSQAIVAGATPATHSASLLAGLRTSEPIPPVPSEIPIGLPSELLRRRPDIRRAEAEIIAEAARLGVARSELYPKFVLSGALGRSANGAGGLTLGVGNFFALGPSVRLPIFNAGRIRSSIRAQDERVNEALLRYENTVYVAVEEVENSLADYQGHRKQLAHLEEAVSSSRRAVDLSRELYTAGLADFLSVLDAQNVLYTNEDELAQSEAAVVLDLVALYKALGGGW